MADERSERAPEQPQPPTRADLEGYPPPSPHTIVGHNPAAAPPPGAYGVAPVAVASPKQSGHAVASLVLGLLVLYGVGSILAIIFGVVEKNKIRESNGWVTGGGMATAGIVLGIVGLIGSIIFFIRVAIDPNALDVYSY